MRRARAAAQGIVPPIILREVEERIPTIDERGQRRIVIRTRTMASFQGPDGTVEIERTRRHTLPGFGHVYPTERDEYVVFRGRMRLRADPEMGVYSEVPLATNDLPPYQQDVDVGAASRSMRALEAQVGLRRKTIAVVAGMILVSLALAIGQLPPQHDPSPSFSTLTPTAPYTGIAEVPDESPLAAFSPTLVQEAQPAASRKRVSPVDNKDVGAQGNLARVALAIRPWGDVYVNGKKRGTSPPIKELRLKPGQYTVEVRNGGFPVYRQDIDLRATTTARMAHDFGKGDTAVAEESGPSLAARLRQQPRFSSEQWPR